MSNVSAFATLPAGTLSSLQSAYIAALTALASNQAYSLNGRSLTRANLSEVQDTLAAINAAIALQAGSTASQTFVSFTGQ